MPPSSRGTCRYPGSQDPNEEGLSLLRAQYENAGFPNLHLAWGDTLPRQNDQVQIFVTDSEFKPKAAVLTLRGDPKGNYIHEYSEA